MKIKKLDELQYLQRGNIFKHCLFTIVALLLCYIAMLDFDIILLAHRNALLLIVIFIISLFCIEMIYHGIYPLSEKRQKFLYILFGLCGLAATVICALEMLSGEGHFIENAMLSDAGTGVIMGCLLFTIFVAYILKTIHTKKQVLEK